MPTASGRHRVVGVVLVGVLLALSLVACSRKAAAPESKSRVTLTVAAASSLRFALPEILAEFAKAHPGTSTEAVYGSSGSLFAQISSKAPYDVFLAADESFPRELLKSRHGVGGSLIRYATGRLLLWAPTGSPLEVSTGLACLTDPSVRKIAIANPALAPYGVAAEEAMKNAGVYDAIRDRLVFGENVAQAAQFVESGSAQAGILALSVVLSPGMKDKGRFWTIPETSHAPIVQAGCICTAAADPQAAERFMAFMQGDGAREILRRHGFGIPGE